MDIKRKKLSTLMNGRKLVFKPGDIYVDVHDAETDDFLACFPRDDLFDRDGSYFENDV